MLISQQVLKPDNNNEIAMEFIISHNNFLHKCTTNKIQQILLKHVFKYIHKITSLYVK